MSFSVRTFQTILDDIQTARAWYCSIGVQTVGTRLELIEEEASSLIRDLEFAAPEQVVERWSKSETYYALSDGHAFGEIAREIGKIGPNLLPKKSLRVILEGPLHPQDEIRGDKSVNARNIFTELELAAHFSKNGVIVSGFDDLKFRLEGIDYSVQCKRLLSVARVAENIQKAYDQLKFDLATDRDRGFIALSVDKLMGTEGKGLRVANESDVTRKVWEQTEAFKRRFGSAWSRFIDPRVIGIFVISRFLCHTVVPNVIGPAYYVSMIPLVSNETFQGNDLRRIRHIVSQFN
jgi:hypothetical protein